MTVPLPGGKADELIWHISHCAACRWARLSPNPATNYCEQGKRLVRETTEERHGRIDQG